MSLYNEIETEIQAVNCNNVMALMAESAYRGFIRANQAQAMGLIQEVIRISTETHSVKKNFILEQLLPYFEDLNIGATDESHPLEILFDEDHYDQGVLDKLMDRDVNFDCVEEQLSLVGNPFIGEYSSRKPNSMEECGGMEVCHGSPSGHAISFGASSPRRKPDDMEECHGSPPGRAMTDGMRYRFVGKGGGGAAAGKDNVVKTLNFGNGYYG
ncbi:MAG: hypothetical protein K0U29_06275 [Gammaproteobacteria bacterium]|nr:hypothetical protein [Gammaproteobacteria bacterium]MCH9744521.1 hypothetical protein [Gammaproteobacteria bacterium]